MTVAQIIHACIKENASGQKELVRKYAPMMMTVSRRYALAHYGPQDILQDALINVFRAIEQFDESKGSFEGWLKKITVNTALKELRKKRLSLSNVEEERNVLSVDPEIYQQLNAEELIQLISTLPEQYKIVFNLSCIEGYSHKEIGNLLGIEVASSRSNLSRAKSILRKKILATKKDLSWVRTG